MIGYYGFGYDSRVNDYKLVCLTRNEVHAYTLKSNSWRRFNTVRHGYCPRITPGLLLNGVLYWSAAATSGENHKFIVSFDISSEEFTKFPFPEEIIQRPKISGAILRVLGDSLCLVCGIRDVGVDIWVMQNYGVMESWVKKFTTSQRKITSYSHLLKLYWPIKTDEILMQVSEGLALYDDKDDRVRLLNFIAINGRFDFLKSESYVESLVSLNPVLTRKIR
ncbi:F-box/kelch-repeat protein At3g06240-like [Papaver somniferum]|uniref:F-box/kelch-repeat protein At3g06240-like n=1 Tax=Papaver somniferum TaxID=3469 RepID=UPI000E6FAECF|nr:F-box/kelch-repeat protein At3g06240-like [Papaver somniferum]